MIDDPGVYECVLCYDTIFNVICMSLCDQEKKIRKEKRDDVIIKIEVSREEEGGR